MAYQGDVEDVFGESQKTPSLSWRSLPVGSVFVLEVLEPPKMLQSRNYDTNQPDYWDEEKKQPIMSGVINVRVVNGPHSAGDVRSVWAQKPSNLFQAISEAQKTAGSRIAAGGILSLKFTSEVPHKDARKNPIKQYAARYEPPVDAFSQPAAQQPWGQPGPATHAGWPAPAQGQAQAPAPSDTPRCQLAQLPGHLAQLGGLCGEPAKIRMEGHLVCVFHEALLNARMAQQPQTVIQPTLPGSSPKGVGGVPF